jgi:hypothetical protein
VQRIAGDDGTLDVEVRQQAGPYPLALRYTAVTPPLGPRPHCHAGARADRPVAEAGCARTAAALPESASTCMIGLKTRHQRHN